MIVDPHSVVWSAAAGERNPAQHRVDGDLAACGQIAPSRKIGRDNGIERNRLIGAGVDAQAFAGSVIVGQVFGEGAAADERGNVGLVGDVGGCGFGLGFGDQRRVVAQDAEGELGAGAVLQ